MEESNKKYTYFASDFHLGAPTDAISLVREKEIVAWLNYIEPTAKEVFLVGDIFDFWFEYKLAIPKGFTRFLGKIADLTDKGIKVHFFCGNHDMWMFDYLEKEVGIELHINAYLGKKEIPDFLPAGKNIYKSSNYDNVTQHMIIVIDALVANVRIERI